MKIKKVSLILFIFAIAISACGRIEAPAVGAYAPDFDAATLHADVISLSDYRGKAVMLNFWATWCPPCRLEMPAIQDRSVRYQDDLVILAINNNEPIELVEEFEAEFGLTLTVVMDPDAVFQDLYQVRGYPTSIFIDSEGIIQNIHVGIMPESLLDGYLSDLGIGN